MEPLNESFFTRLTREYGMECKLNVRNLQKTARKIGRYQNHLVFTLRCKQKQLIPNGLKLKRPVNTHRAQQILDKGERALLNERIRSHHGNWAFLRNKYGDWQSRICAIIPKKEADDIHATAQQILHNESD